MSGFVAWHVIGHQRRFATYLAQQRDEFGNGLSQRSAQGVPSAFSGYGEIGQGLPPYLALLGFPVMVWSRTASRRLPRSGFPWALRVSPPCLAKPKCW